MKGGETVAGVTREREGRDVLLLELEHQRMQIQRQVDRVACLGVRELEVEQFGSWDAVAGAAEIDARRGKFAERPHASRKPTQAGMPVRHQASNSGAGRSPKMLRR